MDLNHVTLPCTNIPNSIEFYERLGLKLIVHTHDGYCRFELSNGNATFSLHKVDEILPNNGSWIYFEVDNLDQNVKELKAKGIVFDQMPKDESWLWREAKLTDPDGNKIILYKAGENRKNPPWRKTK
ncbi:MAG: VOC family protein [Crocinitomicaceae bacterium]|nr:VOC family protein [Crocinitomicaceae bacterium]